MSKKRSKSDRTKRPVNLTLSEEALKMARRLQEKDQRGSLSNLIESLITKAHEQIVLAA